MQMVIADHVRHRSNLSGGAGGARDCFTRNVTRIANASRIAWHRVWGTARVRRGASEATKARGSHVLGRTMPPRHSRKTRETVWVSTLHNCLPWFSKIPAAAINNCLRDLSVPSMLKAVRCSFVRRQVTGCNYTRGSYFFPINGYKT